MGTKKLVLGGEGHAHRARQRREQWGRRLLPVLKASALGAQSGTNIAGISAWAQRSWFWGGIVEQSRRVPGGSPRVLAIAGSVSLGRRLARQLRDVPKAGYKRWAGTIFDQFFRCAPPRVEDIKQTRARGKRRRRKSRNDIGK